MSDERLGEELKRYGLEGMGGDPVDVLLRHIYANHEAALGAKDGTIASLESQNQALQERVTQLEAEQRDALFMAALLIDKAGGEVVLTKQAIVAFDGVLTREDDFDCVIFRGLSLTQETDPE